jgi:hypothetical protein
MARYTDSIPTKPDEIASFAESLRTIAASFDQQAEFMRTNNLQSLPEVRRAIADLPRINEYVIDKPAYRKAADTASGWANANLRTHFLKRLNEASVDPWPRLFHSMRASRQTELQLEFGTPAACAWLGNTEEVAKESYLMVFEKEWQRAVNGAAQKVAQKPANLKGKRGKKTPKGQ